MFRNYKISECILKGANTVTAQNFNINQNFALKLNCNVRLTLTLSTAEEMSTF